MKLTDETFERQLDLALCAMRDLLIERRAKYGDAVFDGADFAETKINAVALCEVMLSLKAQRISLGGSDYERDKDSAKDFVGYYLLREIAKALADSGHNADSDSDVEKHYCVTAQGDLILSLNGEPGSFCDLRKVVSRLNALHSPGDRYYLDNTKGIARNGARCDLQVIADKLNSMQKGG